MEETILESPFLWGIDEQLTQDFDESMLDDEMKMPFFELINFIMKSYIYTVKGNYNEAQISVLKTDEFWKDLDKEEMKRDGVSLDVVYCIIQNTKYHVLVKIADNIKDEKWKTDIQKCSVLPDVSGTLCGCKSAAWSIFHEATMEKAILFARPAVSKNPNCPYWQYLLGKNLRRLRRHEVLLNKPSSEEMECFKKAYELSKDPHYAIYLAVAYQENCDREISTQLCLEIFRMQLPNDKIQLRLARSFIRIRDFAKANLCLDFAERLNPKSVMLPHYRGIYHYKRGNYREAIKYFKKAADGGNISADIQLGVCMKKIYNDFSILFHWLLLLRKVESRKENHRKIMLAIALEFYKCENYQKALKYFLKAIKLFPMSENLKNFCIPGCAKPYNVLRFIDEVFLPKCKKISGEFSIEMLNALKNLEDIRNQNKVP